MPASVSDIKYALYKHLIPAPIITTGSPNPPIPPDPTPPDPPPVGELQHVWTGADPTAQADPADYEVGSVFSFVNPVTIYKNRIWNPGTTNKPGRTCKVWRVSTGEKIAEVALPATMPTGWSEKAFTTPLYLSPGVQYIVSYDTGANDYGAIDVPLTSNSDVHFDAPMKYNATPGLMPGQTGNGFYGVDIVYEPVTTGYQLQPGHVGWQHTGVALTTYTGPAVYSTPGGILDSLDFPDGIVINAANVTLKRSRVKTFGNIGILVRENGHNCLVEDVEITSLNPPSQMLDRAISFEGQGLGVPDNCTARRLYVHEVQRGGRFGQNTDYLDCYIRENINATAAHTTALSSNGGATNPTIDRCNLASETGTNASSAVSMYPEIPAGGPNTGILITRTLMEADAEFIIYLGYTPPETPNTNVKVNNNWFGTKYHPNGGIQGIFANWLANQAGDECNGNKWYDLRPTGGGYTNKHGQPVTNTD